MFVVGGTYKGFYLNQFKKIKYVDLLIFNQNIFYDIDYEKDCLIQHPVCKEIIELNSKLKCPILVYGILNKNKIKQKVFILCINKKISIINNNKNIYLYIKKKLILINNNLCKNKNIFACIEFEDGIIKSKPCQIKCQNYFLCKRKSVLYMEKVKSIRKFRKYCYFTLNLNKKML